MATTKRTSITQTEETPIVSKMDRETEIKKRLLSEGMKERVITVTSNDPRDNNETSAFFATCENKFINKSMFIPAGIPVKVPQCIIDTLKDVEITFYRDEIIKGQRTGNKIPTRIKKYTISYEDAR